MKIVSPSHKILDEYLNYKLITQIERCGRLCYKSEDKITEGSAEGFVKRIIQSGHESVLEMANITLKISSDSEITLIKFLETVPKFFQVSKTDKGSLIITGSPRSYRDLARSHPNIKLTKAIMLYLTPNYPVLFDDLQPKNGWIPQDGINIKEIALSEIEKLPIEIFIKHKSLLVHFITNRAVTHELVRHRVASYLQESQRYCRYNQDKFGGEITFIKPVFYVEGSNEFDIWKKTMEISEANYMELIKTSTPQAARTVLPNSCKTEIMVNAYIEEWLHILKLRTSMAADPSIREIMLMLLEELIKKYPNIFDIFKNDKK